MDFENLSLLNLKFDREPYQLKTGLKN